MECKEWYLWMSGLHCNLWRHKIIKKSRRLELEEFRNEFAQKPLSSGIATLPSLLVLDSILRTYEIKNVLEIGRGLGTLTKFIGQNFNVNIYSVESDSYCIKESALNCTGISYSHFREIHEIDFSILESLDLVVIDGPIPRSSFRSLFNSNKNRIFFFENHQLVTKIRVLSFLFSRGRHSRYVEMFPFHNFEGPSYVVSLPRWSLLSLFSNYISLWILLAPRFIKHCFTKLTKRKNPFIDSYRVSQWNHYS